MVSGNNGILAKVVEAKSKTEKAREDEKVKLALLEAGMNLNGMEHKETIGGEEVTVKIPEGFIESPREGENSIENGLVILDSNGNEFVWVPINDINLMIMCKNHSGSNPCDIDFNETTGKLYCKNHPGIELCSKLYNSKSVMSRFDPNRTDQVFETAENTPAYYSIGPREPDIISGSGSNLLDASTVFSTKLNKNWTSVQLMQEGLKTKFEEMALSVYKNKGFYIGRYELGVSDSNIFVTKKYSSLANMMNWYDLYNGCENVSKNNNYYSTMIYGCQWDATLKWLLDRNQGLNISDLSQNGNYDDIAFSYSDEKGNVYNKYKEVYNSGRTNIVDSNGNVVYYFIESDASSYSDEPYESISGWKREYYKDGNLICTYVSREGESGENYDWIEEHYYIYEGKRYDEVYDHIVPGTEDFVYRYINDSDEFTNNLLEDYKTKCLIKTGSSEYTKINNIYDLAGNVGEMTQEAIWSGSRSIRGQWYSRGSGSTEGIGYRETINPDNSSWAYYGSRPVLILK